MMLIFSDFAFCAILFLLQSTSLLQNALQQNGVLCYLYNLFQNLIKNSKFCKMYRLMLHLANATEYSIEDDLKDGFLSILKIEPFLHKKAKTLSGGMQKRLSIACALASRPTLLLLDEPDAALDLVCKEDIREYIRLYCAQGNTVLLATHEEADFDLCSKLILLKDGHARTLAADTPVKEIIEYLS